MQLVVSPNATCIIEMVPRHHFHYSQASRGDGCHKMMMLEVDWYTPPKKEKNYRKEVYHSSRKFRGLMYLTMRIGIQEDPGHRIFKA